MLSIAPHNLVAHLYPFALRATQTRILPTVNETMARAAGFSAYAQQLNWQQVQGSRMRTGHQFFEDSGKLTRLSVLHMMLENFHLFASRLIQRFPRGHHGGGAGARTRGTSMRGHLHLGEGHLGGGPSWRSLADRAASIASGETRSRRSSSFSAYPWTSRCCLSTRRSSLARDDLEIGSRRSTSTGWATLSPRRFGRSWTAST